MAVFQVAISHDIDLMTVEFAALLELCKVIFKGNILYYYILKSTSSCQLKSLVQFDVSIPRNKINQRQEATLVKHITKETFLSKPNTQTSLYLKKSWQKVSEKSSLMIQPYSVIHYP